MVKAFERFKDIEQNFKHEPEKQKEWLKDYKGIQYSIAEFEKHFMKWQTEKKLYDSFDPAINCIGRHPRRLIIEFDDHAGNEKDKEKIKENIEKTKQKLLDKGWGFIESTHNGASNYLWVEFTRDLTSKEAENFLKWIAPIGSEPDLNFASDKKVAQVMYARHWRHSNEREMPVGFWDGEQIDYDSLNIPLKLPGIIRAITEDNFEYKTFVKTEKMEPLTEERIKNSKEVIKLMYEEIIGVLKDYLVMQEHQYKFIAIWILGTYSHEYFNTYPFLFFNAMRGSGKTRALKLISALGKGGDGSVENNLTEACLFRIPRGRTTCIDEVEQIGNKEKATLRELLNAAYKKGMKVRRMKKVKIHNQEKQVAEVYEPYFPIAMANINGIEEVLADRAVTLILEKSDDPEKTRKAEDFINNIKIQWIMRTLEQFSGVVEFLSQKKHLEKWNFWLKSTYNSTNSTNSNNSTNSTNSTNPIILKYLEMTKQNDMEIDEEMKSLFKQLNESGITGRNFELFMPLLILAKFIGEDVFEDIFNIAKNLVHEKKQDERHESVDVSLYQFALSKEDDYKSYVPTRILTREFKTYIGDDDNRDSTINEKWMGKALKRLNLILEKRKMSYAIEVKLNYTKAREKLKIFL